MVKHTALELVRDMGMSQGEDGFFEISPLFDVGFRALRGRPTLAPTRIHLDVELNIAMRGTANLLFVSGVRTLRTGILVVFWAGTPHRVLGGSDDSDLVSISIPLNDFLVWDLPSATVRRVLAGEVLEEKATSRRRRQTDGLLAEQWLEDLTVGDLDARRAAYLEMGARVRRMRSTTLRQSLAGHVGWPGRDPSIRLAPIVRVVEYVGRRFDEKLSVPAIAQAAGLHPNYLMHRFKSVMGMPLWEYVIRVRLAYSQRLLITTDLSVLQIWLAAGFGSSARFYDCFHRYVGIEPREFRAQQRDRVAPHQARQCGVA